MVPLQRCSNFFAAAGERLEIAGLMERRHTDAQVEKQYGDLDGVDGKVIDDLNGQRCLHLFHHMLWFQQSHSEA